MNSEMRLEIHFHQEDEASVYIESNAVEEHQKQTDELFMFSALAARQIVNVGNDHKGTSSLASSLALLGKDLGEDLDSFSGLARSGIPGAAKLVDYKGAPGRKQFIATLTDAGFYLSAKGFGILARGVGYYAPNSVMVLFQHLAKRREGDKMFLYKLSKAAQAIGTAYLNGQLSIATQYQVVAAVMQYAFKAAEVYALTSAGDEIGIHSHALAGDAEGQFELASMYYKGSERPQDYETAMHWFRKAADQGLVQAQFMVGRMFYDGEGVPVDHEEAKKWFRMAADNGFEPARRVLSQLSS